MRNVDCDIAVCYQAGMSAVAASCQTGIARRQVKAMYRALAFREAEGVLRDQERAVQERAACLNAAGVRRALQDGDPGGTCLDYPLDSLLRWGLKGVPSCFGIGRA